jgi:HD-GYP domain-containing protein (c-di-GMP phosphodiesterase class II)
VPTVATRVNPLLIVAADHPFAPALLERHEGEIELRRVPTLPMRAELDPLRPTVILLDRVLLESARADPGRVNELARVAALVGQGGAGEVEPPAEFPAALLTGYLPARAPAASMVAMLRGAFRHAASIVGEHRAAAAREQHHRELSELTTVGLALSTERNLVTLLEMILSQARRITTSDAGSIYLAARDGERPASLRFMLAQNDTIPSVPLSNFSVPVDHSSLAGHAATTGDMLMIDDVYDIPHDAPYAQNRSFDDRLGYHTRSMLVIPMKTHRGEIIGVLQLINRKRNADAPLTSTDAVAREVVPYDRESIELLSAIASQAAVAIDNNRLYEEIEQLFEGFVTAAVTAIESRDPATSGHSGRVATLTVGLAEAVDRLSDGPYRDLRFTHPQLRELRYAGLLHDFGKVGVREEVLVKEKKLYPRDLEVIRHRFAFLLQEADLSFERERHEVLLTCGRDSYDRALSALELSRRAARDRITHYLDAILRANEPTVLPEGTFEDLREMRNQSYVDFDGVERPLLREDELRFLMIQKGNLDDRERREIESHVTHTYRFLEQIPWTRELRSIPYIAYTHHEKLNGRGYPRAVTGDAIPVEARMMTIADIFDALTATDRPYKPALTYERALGMLEAEARDGMIDADLLRAFIDGKIYTAVGATSQDGFFTAP